MNKKGFTLIELIAVLVLIVLVSMLTFPNLRNLMKNNNEKEFKTYEDMMINYAKVIPNYKSRDHICLSDLNLKKINDNMKCNGYVKIDNGTLTSYLLCKQNDEQIWKTKINSSDTWTIPSECEEE